MHKFATSLSLSLLRSCRCYHATLTLASSPSPHLPFPLSTDTVLCLSSREPHYSRAVKLLGKHSSALTQLSS